MLMDYDSELRPAEPVSYLNNEQTAVVLGIMPDTLRRWCRAGKGPPSHRVGRRRRFNRAELLAWVEARREEGGR